MNDSAVGVSVEALDDINDLLRDAVVSEDLSDCCPVDHVKHLFVVNKVDV